MPDTVVDVRLARGRYTATIGGLFAVTFAAAYGVARLRAGSWDRALLSAAVAWIVVGLAAHAWRIWKAYRGRADLDRDERFGWHFAMGWRLAAAGLLVLLEVATALTDRGIWQLDIQYQQYRSDQVVALDELIAAMRLVLLLLAVSTVGGGAPRDRRGAIWNAASAAIGWVGAAIVGLAIWHNRTTLAYLTHALCHEWYLKYPPNLAIMPEGADLTRLEDALAVGAAAASGLLLVNLGLVSAVSGGERRAASRRRACGALLVAGLAANLWFVAWSAVEGIPRLAPHVADTYVFPPLNLLAFAIGLILLPATVAAYRISRGAPMPWPIDGGSAARPAASYHERALFLIALSLVLAMPLCMEVVDMVHELAKGWPLHETTLARGLIEETRLPLSVLLLAATAIAAFKAVRRPPSEPPHAPSRLSPWRFTAAWLASVVLLAAAVPTLGLLAFSMWFW